jgi:hypothetical protein
MIMRVLELCAGSKSFTKVCTSMGWDCTTVDVNPRYEPDILADVRALHFTEGEFDVIWASPPCEHYSIAKTRGERNLALYDSIAQACLRIIDEVKPLVWIVENPMGLLRHRPFMAGLPKWTVDYCMFGAPYRKRTDLFMSDNMGPLTDILCDKTCGQVDKKGRHINICQNGPSDRKPGATYTGKLDSRHSVPPALCVGIFIKIQSIISNKGAEDGSEGGRTDEAPPG